MQNMPSERAFEVVDRDLPVTADGKPTKSRTNTRLGYSLQRSSSRSRMNSLTSLAVYWYCWTGPSESSKGPLIGCSLAGAQLFLLSCYCIDNVGLDKLDSIIQKGFQVCGLDARCFFIAPSVRRSSGTQNQARRSTNLQVTEELVVHPLPVTSAFSIPLSDRSWRTACCVLIFFQGLHSSDEIGTQIPLHCRPPCFRTWLKHARSPGGNGQFSTRPYDTPQLAEPALRCRSRRRLRTRRPRHRTN